MGDITTFFELLNKFGIIQIATLMLIYVMFVRMMKIINKDEQLRCYYRLKADLEDLSGKHVRTGDQITEVLSQLTSVKKDLANVCDRLWEILQSVSDISKTSTDTQSDVKLKFEEIAHKIEILSTTMDRVIDVLVKLNRDGEL